MVAMTPEQAQLHLDGQELVARIHRRKQEAQAWAEHEKKAGTE